jgi:hypothetical protein
MSAAAKTVLCAIATALAWSAPALADLGQYDLCPTVGVEQIVAVSNASCEDVGAVAAAVAAAQPDQTPAALRAAGWRPLRSEADESGSAFDLVAIRGHAALRIRRSGSPPDLDGWMAGRELILARPKLVGGQPPPDGAVVCTSAFLIKLRGHPGGLTAGHCGGVRSDGTTHRHNAAMRRPPQPGIVLGRVQRNLKRTRPIDALVLPVPSGLSRPSADVVDRGVSRPPWFVVGTARPESGRRVCFSGRTSGIDQCGAILIGRGGRQTDSFASRIGHTRVICTSIPAREGDSGGPVYTRPTSSGTVRAVGITTLVFGLFQTMCFTAISPILDALHATLVTAGAG